MAEVPVVLRILTQGQQQASQELKSLTGDLRGILGVLDQGAGFARGFALALGGLAVGLVGLGGAAVTAAGEFEQLQVKLESVLHSSARAREVFGAAVELAAKTPFDVKGIVQASVILETFGQRSQEVLPLAANLAAAFGVQVQETGLVLGKAFSGSLEGFESLRNTFGISNVELAKFGAELTKTGGISVQTSGDLEKARQALTRIIQTKFGDAVNRQSQTLFGALSNLGDAVTRLGAIFGQALLPLVTTVTRTFTSFVEVFEGIPRVLRDGLVAAGVLGAGLAGMGAVVLGLGAAFSAAAVQVGTFALAMGEVGAASVGATTGMTSAAVAATGLGRAGALAAGAARGLAGFLATPITLTGGITAATTAFSALGPAIAGATTAALGFLATPLGAALLALAAAAGAAFLSMQHLQDLQEASRALDEQSRDLQGAVQSWRTYRNVVVNATGVQQGFIAEGGSAGTVATQLAEAFRQVSPVDLVNNATKAGVSLASLRKALSENNQEADKTRASLQALATVMRLLESGPTLLGRAGLSQEDAAAVKLVEELLKGQAITTETVTQATKSLGVELLHLGNARQAISGLLGAFEQVSPKFDEAAKAAESFGSFLKFALKSDDVGELNDALELTQERIKQVEASLASTGLNTSTQALQQRLITAGPDEQKAIEALLGLRESQANIEQKISQQQKTAVQERIRAIEAQAEREKLLGQENLAGERQRLQEVLGTVREGSQEEIQILRRIEAIDTETRRNRVQAAREQFSDTVQAAREAVEQVNASGTASAQDHVAAIQGAITKLEAWRNGNQALLEQNPELRRQFETTFQGFERDLNRAKLAIPKERLEDLLRTAEAFNQEAVTTPQKLAAVGQQIDLLTQGLASGQINTTETRTKLQDKINSLKREEVKLTAQAKKEEDQQARETAQLRQQGLETELELLKEREAMGEKVSRFTIQAKENEILAGRLQAIKDQERAEIDAGVSIEQARQRTELRITQMRQQETLKRIQALRQETDAVQKESDAQKAIRDKLEGLKSQRLGGSASPLISLEELSLQSQLPGFGSIDPDKLKFSTSSGSKFRQAEQEVNARFRRAQALDVGPGGLRTSTPPIVDPGPGRGNAAASPTGPPSIGLMTTNIYVDGAAASRESISKAGLEMMRHAINEEFRKNRLLKGPGAGPLNGGIGEA